MAETLGIDALLNEEGKSGFSFIDAILITTEHGILDENLPDLQLTANISGGRLDANLPDLQLTGQFGENAWTGDRGTEEWGLNLPDLRLDATFGERIELDEDIPGLELEARFGLRLDDPELLPDLRLSASASWETFLSLDENLPQLTLNAGRSGGQCDVRLPNLTISATFSTDITGGLTKDLTFPTLSASMILPYTGILSKALTFPTISASATGSYIGTLSANLPGLQITATAYVGGVGTLDATLPNLQITATGIASETATLDANLPALQMGAVASGDTGGQTGGVMSNKNRFTDYVMRYSRW